MSTLLLPGEAVFRWLWGVCEGGRRGTVEPLRDDDPKEIGGFTLVLTLFVTRNVMIRRYFATYPDQNGRQQSSLMD